MWLGTALLVTTRDLKYRRWRPRLAERLELLGSLNLVVSPTVLGAGLFVLLLPMVDVMGLALPLVVIVNGIIFVPYVLRTLGPAFYRVAENHDRLCASLGVRGLDRLRLVEFRQQPGQALRQHRLAGSGWSGHQQVVAARRGDLQRTARLRLAPHIG